MAQRFIVVLLVSVTIALPGVADASCMPDAASSFWPYDSRLPANGILIGQADGALRAWMSGIAERGPYLLTEGDEVPLEVVQAVTYGHSDVQVVLRPARLLKVGRRYALRLRSPLGDELERSLKAWDPRTKKIVTRAWVASPPVEETSRWSEPPTAIGVEAKRYGCGSAVHHRFSAQTSAGSGWLLVEAEGEKFPRYRTRALVLLEGDAVRVGHGMCGGPFRFEKGVRYRLKFSALNAKGELVPAPGQGLEIVGTE